jgi:CheY-like chemotaxis protein
LWKTISQAELVKRTLEAHQIVHRLHHVGDGEAALAYLFRQGEYADPATSPRPHVVLLDLRLPTLSGLEVLKAIRASREVHTVPVVVLTTSTANGMSSVPMSIMSTAIWSNRSTIRSLHN